MENWGICSLPCNTYLTLVFQKKLTCNLTSELTHPLVENNAARRLFYVVEPGAVIQYGSVRQMHGSDERYDRDVGRASDNKLFWMCSVVSTIVKKLATMVLY